MSFLKNIKPTIQKISAQKISPNNNNDTVQVIKTIETIK